MRIITRYAWTVFVLLAGILLLWGFSDLTAAHSPVELENALNELMVGALGGAIAVCAFRSGARWAWFAMAAWPVWLMAQTSRSLGYGAPEEAGSSVVLLVLVLVALAVTYRRAA